MKQAKVFETRGTKFGSGDTASGTGQTPIPDRVVASSALGAPQRPRAPARAGRPS